MKLSLIMDPQDTRCKEIKKACKNNNIKFNLLQYDYNESIASKQKKILNKISD